MAVEVDKTVKDQQMMEVSAMALLHRIAMSVGGRLTIKLADIPEKLPFNFRIENGIGIFTALEKPKTTLVPAQRVPFFPN